MLNYPLTQYMFCSPDEGAAAVVLCKAEKAHKYTDTPVYLRANDSDFHSSFFRNVHQGDSDFNGMWSESFAGDDEVWMSCRMFDNTKGGAENNVALRMVTQLHEGWHAWENWWIEG